MSDVRENVLMDPKLHFSSNQNPPEPWDTPKDFFDKLNEEFQFDLDAAATGMSRKCEKYLGLDNGINALEVRWSEYGKTIFCNPPYSRKMKPWFKKIIEARDDGCTVMVLVFVRTDTEWFHEYAYKEADEIRFVKGKLKFGDGKIPAPVPSMVLVYGLGRANE